MRRSQKRHKAKGTFVILSSNKAIRGEGRSQKALKPPKVDQAAMVQTDTVVYFHADMNTARLNSGLEAQSSVPEEL